MDIANKYEKTPQNLKVRPKKKGKLAVQIDELGSFVKNNKQKQWVWVALDQQTREIVGLYVGDRSEKSAKALFSSLPAV